MFKAGDYIHYGAVGLCRIEEITTLNMSGASQEKLYYHLTPITKSGGAIYTPVDNQKVPMRRALSREEADELLRQMPTLEVLTLPAGNKHAEAMYKDALSSPDCRVWVRLVKTLYYSREARKASGKKATSTQERYYREAQERLDTELANAMGVNPQEVLRFIEESLREKKEPIA